MDYLELAALLAARHAARSDAAGKPIAVALAGGQGAGKSTLARMIVDALERRGKSAFACSLDDFYLTRKARLERASRLHPLFATRGVPGTHDLELLSATLDRVLAGAPTLVPVFDKGTDDRAGEQQWRAVNVAPSVVILEGWCLGARPEPPAALELPANTLERDDDPDGRFRRFVNTALAGEYAALNARFVHLAFLAVPGIEAVRRWRSDQEQALPEGQRMSAAALDRFIAHYERLTRWMLADLAPRADVTATLGPSHEIIELHERAFI